MTQSTGQLPLRFPNDEIQFTVNSSVDGQDQVRLSGQASDIYAALVDGPKFNFELVSLPTNAGKRRFIHNMTARISEIRNWLNPKGRDVLAYRLPDGIWLYKIGPCQTVQSSEHRIGVVVNKINRHLYWTCPCCGADVSSHETKRTGKQIEKNPLCPSCQKRLESPCRM